MNAKMILIRLGIGLAVVAGMTMAIVWWPKASADAVAGSEIWTCSMHPQIRMPNPEAARFVVCS